MKLAKIGWATLGISIATGACGLAAGAAVGVVWSRSEVIPVVLVKPGIGGFEPIDGSVIGNRWTKDQVKAVILIKPGISGFEPREGTTIGNTWRKDDVLPVMLVEPSASSFVPLRVIGDEQNPYSTQQKPGAGGHTDVSASPSVIEDQIAGEFTGWAGETIVRLTNGQIWQQSEYYYTYHYAYSPRIIIYRSAGGYKMKVDGVDRAVGVTQLR
jgi:hypothetical protein